MAALAIGAGLGAVAVLRGTSPAVVGVGIALYLLGLDGVEPLAQEVDHPDHTDGIPRPRGWVMARHTWAPAIALVPFAAIAAAVVVIARPPEWPLAAALLVPITLGGACGAVVSIVRDAPDPIADGHRHRRPAGVRRVHQHDAPAVARRGQHVGRLAARRPTRAARRRHGGALGDRRRDPRSRGGVVGAAA